MVQLTAKIIEVINKITDAVKDTDYEVERFDISCNGLGEPLIEFRLQKK